MKYVESGYALVIHLSGAQRLMNQTQSTLWEICTWFTLCRVLLWLRVGQSNPCLSGLLICHTYPLRFVGPAWGPSGADRTQVAPCWPHELYYLGPTIFRLPKFPVKQYPTNIGDMTLIVNSTNQIQRIRVLILWDIPHISRCNQYLTSINGNASTINDSQKQIRYFVGQEVPVTVAKQRKHGKICTIDAHWETWHLSQTFSSPRLLNDVLSFSGYVFVT